MKKTDIDRLLEGRRITEEYEQDSAPGESAKWAFVRELQSIGFNSPKIFSDWNDQMNRIAYKECVTIDGHCDNCKGYEGAPLKPLCLQLFTKGSPMNIWYIEGQSCYAGVTVYEEDFQRHINERDAWTSNYDRIVEIFFRLMRIGYTHYDVDKTKTRGSYVCPEGHGISVVQVKDLPFDIGWERS